MSRAWVLGAILAGCGASAPVEPGDPCAPDGHIHREPEGDWCHCDRGFRAAASGLACEVDPTFVEGTDVQLGGASAERACWLAMNGPIIEVAGGGSLNVNLAAFRVRLPGAGPAVSTATLGYRGAVSAVHVLSVSPATTVVVEEEVEGTRRRVPLVRSEAMAQCPQHGLAQQLAFSLASRVTYFVTISSAQPEVMLVVDQL